MSMSVTGAAQQAVFSNDATVSAKSDVQINSAQLPITKGDFESTGKTSNMYTTADPNVMRLLNQAGGGSPEAMIQLHNYMHDNPQAFEPNSNKE